MESDVGRLLVEQCFRQKVSAHFLFSFAQLLWVVRKVRSLGSCVVQRTFPLPSQQKLQTPKVHHASFQGKCAVVLRGFTHPHHSHLPLWCDAKSFEAFAASMVQPQLVGKVLQRGVRDLGEMTQVCRRSCGCRGRLLPFWSNFQSDRAAWQLQVNSA